MKKITLTFLILTAIIFGGLVFGDNLTANAQPTCGTPPYPPCPPASTGGTGGITGPPAPSGGIPNPIGSDTFEDLLEAITNFLLIISIPIVSIMVLYGGFQILTAAGTPEKIEKGKKTIIYSIVGFIVILLANGAALIIKDILS